MALPPHLVIRKVSLRLIPFLALCYFVAFLDRVNVGFAALTMNKDLGLSAAAYGFGASIFFLGYFLFEVPSNLLLERVGARLWIARIMITWGVLSAAMAAVAGPWSFYLVRFLLGIAEAGFFPGIILYLTYWFPAEYRARIVGLFMVAIPVSSVLGAPISGWILDAFEGVGGLRGWQWLFILEGVPSVIVGVAVLLYLTDKPAEAAWLEPDARGWLTRTLERERASREAIHSFTLRQALAHPRVLALSLVYFGIVIGLYGIGFFMPTILKGFGLGNIMVGGLTAVPYLVAAIGMVLWGRSSDRTGERKWHSVIAALIGAVGFVASGAVGSVGPAVVALSVAALGIYAALPVFWTLPTAILTGTAAAGGIALINAIGNLGGFFGPSIVGWTKDVTGSFASGLYVLAGFMLLAGIIVLVLGHDPRLERAEAADAAGPLRR